MTPITTALEKPALQPRKNRQPTKAAASTNVDEHQRQSLRSADEASYLLFLAIGILETRLEDLDCGLAHAARTLLVIAKEDTDRLSPSELAAGAHVDDLISVASCRLAHALAVLEVLIEDDSPDVAAQAVWEFTFQAKQKLDNVPVPAPGIGHG